MSARDPHASLREALSGSTLLGEVPHEDLKLGLFELSPLGLMLVELDTATVVDANAAMTRITGHSRDELLRGHADPVLDPRTWTEGEGPLAKALQRRHIGPLELDLQHKSGRTVHVECRSLRVLDAQHQAHVWLSFTDVTERHALERQLRAAAHRDPLTGLANRAALRQALQAQISSQRHALIQAEGGPSPAGVAVIFLDLDRFKFINDTLGHNAGDDMLCAVALRLRAVAHRLRSSARPEAAWTVSRLGGDEFVLVVPDAADTESAMAAGHAVMQALSEPYTVRQYVLPAGASIGVALWNAKEAAAASGTDSTDADALMRDADIAMYEAKHAGRGRCVLFDDTMRARLNRAVVIENELRHAVARGQLEAVYQPIVDLETGAMRSVEALLRWTHPELGPVSPNEFIPVAEESGHIQALGEWILRTACKQWTAWQTENAAVAPATMSVNLSREQMALGERVLTVVREALADAAMPAAALQLEITEREVMKSPEQARSLLLELSAMGVKLAMDDFGTGTSSLGCLRDYPFDTIKIDKSFVTNLCRDPQVLAVAHATVNVIENLGMVSVAEGIEDPAEVAALQAMGCHYGQGYLFAKPLPGKDLLAAMGTLG